MASIKKNSTTTTQTFSLISTPTALIFKVSSLDDAETETTKFTTSHSKPTSTINTNTLKLTTIYSKDPKIFPKSSKSNYDLVMAPRSLDDQNEEYIRSTATATEETLKGQINFSNIYKNSSNLLKCCLSLILFCVTAIVL